MTATGGARLAACWKSRLADSNSSTCVDSAIQRCPGRHAGRRATPARSVRFLRNNEDRRLPEGIAPPLPGTGDPRQQRRLRRQAVRRILSLDRRLAGLFRSTFRLMVSVIVRLKGPVRALHASALAGRSSSSPQMLASVYSLNAPTNNATTRNLAARSQRNANAARSTG